ncbi:Hypothetical predicted protein [Lynx pardinus]|uniref:Uncharacterized protein n=1 Tax=Lynx pardinus TaxID=191816 RepID=A0A485NPB9_LYNPA|nr:Hypothetical predicted protein [Lynx pardinus]
MAERRCVSASAVILAFRKADGGATTQSGSLICDTQRIVGLIVFLASFLPPGLHFPKCKRSQPVASSDVKCSLRCGRFLSL